MYNNECYECGHRQEDCPRRWNYCPLCGHKLPSLDELATEKTRARKRYFARQTQH